MSGTSNITVAVPLTVDAVQQPLMQIRLSLDVVQNQPFSFSATSGKGITTTSPQGPFGPGSAVPPSYVFGTNPNADDVLDITPPASGLNNNDPQNLRYELFMSLHSDYNPITCATTMTAPETWSLAVTAGPNISSAGVGSFTRQHCTGAFIPVLATSQVQVATVSGAGLGEQASRPGADVVLVLDRSGSMASPAIDGLATPTRITELQQSFVEFSNVWNNLRGSESAPPVDNIGVTIFDDQISWWPAIPSGLIPFTPSLNTTIAGNSASITPRNLTSIGGGLLQGDSALSTVDPTRRRVILLMSDGLQNTDPMVGVMGNQVVTYSQNSPNVTTPLPNQSNYQIYTVTVGPSNLVNAQINMQIAQVTKGFYTNSENDATLLDQFFNELLQNFVHFTSWETFRIVQAQLTQAAQTYTTTVPVSTTTVSVAVSLRAIQPNIPLRLSVTPSGKSTPTQATTVNGLAVLSFNVPTSSAYDYMSQWTIVVDLAPGLLAARAFDAAGVSGLTFNLYVLGDDIGLRTDLSIVPADYIPGQPIHLAAKLIQFGKPIKGLGSSHGDKLVVEVVKPGTSVGDLLSASTAPATQPFGTDPVNSAQAKLFNQLQANPASLGRISGDVVTLVDDGTGVYRGSYSVQTPGHYNFLFGIESSSGDVGSFSRQQIKTIYVRAKPDGTATNIQTSTQAMGGGNQLTVIFTPRTQFGNRLGPGWANYFWLTTPGQTPFKALDNLDGTYTAKLLYGSILPPPVTLNFIDVPMVIGDATTPDKLPVPLGSGTVLVPFVNPLPFPLPLSLPKLLLFLLLIGFILGLIIGLLI